MPTKKELPKLMLGLAMLFAISSSAFSEELLSDQDLLSEPKAQAAVSAKAKKGQVSIVEKQGFWVKIKAGDATGWTKFSNVKATSSGGLGMPDTGRSSSGNIVSTSGVRGLDGGDLVNAKPDLAELNKLTALKTSKEQGASFASAAGLQTRKINYLSLPANK